MKLQIILQFILCCFVFSAIAQQTTKSDRSAPLCEQDIHVEKVINVTDLGAKPNSGRNDWESFNRAFSKMQQAGEKVKLVIPAGTYHLEAPSDRTYLFRLQNITEFIIEGQDVLLIIDNPVQAFLNLNSCSKGIIKGISVDYSILPFAQGRITGVDKSNLTFDFEVDSISPSPLAKNFVESNTKWGVLFDKNKPTELKKKSVNLVAIRNISTLIPEKLFRITTQRNAIEDLEFNDPFAIIARYNGRATYNTTRSQRITFLNNTNYAGPAGGFSSRDSDELAYVNCRIIQKEGRLISQNADCMHVLPGRIGPWVEHCLFEGQMDDAINLKTELVYIKEVIAPNQFVVTSQLSMNDKLALFNPREGVLIGECAVLRIVKHAAGYLITTDKDFDNLRTGTDKTSDMFFNMNKSNAGFILKDNIFRNSRRYGMLVQATNGLIEGNRFENISTGAIVLQNSAGWPEGFVPSQVMISNNIIHNCGFDKSFWNEREQAAPVMLRTNTYTKTQALWQGISNITIKGNEIHSNSDKAVFISGAKNVWLVKNKGSVKGGGDLYALENHSQIVIE